MSGGGSSGAGAGGEAEVSSAVLSAPPGWTKKVTPLKGGTPKRKEIIFVAPTGEELSSKRQVEKYLKSHPGGPDLSEFYWGSGETPRRSARLKTKEVDTPESEPPKKRSRKSLEKKGDDTETEAALEEEQGDDVQMHDTEAAVTEAAAEVKAVEETPELNKIDDFRAPVAPSGEAAPVAPSVEVDVVKESLHDDSVETKKDDSVETKKDDSVETKKDDSVETKKDDTVAEGTTEEILISENMPLSGNTEVAVKDDTKNGKASEDTQVKVDINVQEDASNEQQQVKVDCPEVVVGEKDEVVVGDKDVARETEHVGWTREIQVEDGNLPSSTLFDDKKEGDSGPAADTTPKVTGNSCISAEDGEVKPQPPQQKYAIDLEQLPAP